MIKTLIKLLLSICIILWSGYGQAYGHVKQGRIYYSPLKKPRQTEDYCSITIQSKLSLALPSSSTYTGKKYRVVDFDMELVEEELIPSKKYFEISDFYTLFFNTGASDYFTQDIKRSLASFKDFSYSSSFRSLHLIFQVFRV